MANPTWLSARGRLPAIQVGGSYAIDEADLKLVKDQKPGRPPTQKGIAITKPAGKSERLLRKDRVSERVVPGVKKKRA